MKKALFVGSLVIFALSFALWTRMIGEDYTMFGALICAGLPLTAFLFTFGRHP